MDDIAKEMEQLFTPLGGSHGSKNPPIDFDTPHQQSMRSTNVYVDGDLKARRHALEKDLGPIPEVSVDFLLQHLLPKCGVDVDATVAKLKAVGTLNEHSVWQEFVQTPYAQYTDKNIKDRTRWKKPDPQNEAQIFQKLKGIYDSIVAQAQFEDQSTDRQPTLVFVQNPDRIPASKTDNRTRPDGYGVLNDDQAIHTNRVRSRRSDDLDYTEAQKPSTKKQILEPPVQWLDIAFVEEYKPRNTIDDRNDNVQKILWSLHFLMNLDHRRRFCFGITVENVDMKVWLACREVVIVTQPFDFTTSPSQLVTLISSLAFAQPTDLGYDPTMKLYWHSKEIGFLYDIECSGELQNGTFETQVYRTEEVLHSAYNLRGRATRVYLVKKLERETRGAMTPGRYFILKDSWIDTHRMKEGDILRDLLKNATSQEKKLFLTAYQHGVVQIDGQNDRTSDLILKGRKITAKTRSGNEPGSSVRPPVDLGNNTGSLEERANIFELSVSGGANSTSGSRATTGSKGRNNSKDTLRHATHRTDPRPTIYSPKDHYRIIFEETGESLMNIIDNAKLTTRMLDQVIREVTTALQYMARRGYVHRDVSPGNIVWYEGCAKLGDLDFAKQYGTEGSSFVRTATYNFMPGEAMKKTYSTNPYSKAPFVYNPVHDLEALWWLGVYCISMQYPAPFKKVTSPNTGVVFVYETFSAMDLESQSKLQQRGVTMFPSSYNSSHFETRMALIHDSDSDYLAFVADNTSTSIGIFATFLDMMRQCISVAYTEIQSNLPRKEASYFTELLRISDPFVMRKKQPSGRESLEKAKQLQVHDAVLRIFTARQYTEILEDAILWPVEASAEEYRDFLETTELKRKLRPRRRQVMKMD